MDSMMEIFYEEAVSLTNELNSIIKTYKDCQTYNADYIKKVFRVVHTMKADSTMMLLDTIAVPSRVFESLLVFFRNNKIDITDKECFDKIIANYTNYISEDIEKFAKGVKLEQDHKDLEDDIKNYLERLKKEYNKEDHDDTQPVHEEAGKKPRQVYYIAADTESASVPEKKPEEKKASEKPKIETPSSGSEVVLVKQDDINRMYKSIKHYNSFMETIEKRFKGDRSIEIRHKDLMMLKNIKHELLVAADHLTKSDFVAVAQKMELVVDEMSRTLNKPVKLITRGASSLVDKSKREKISSALVHVIRNAVDHGIEDMDERDRMGKAPVGIVRLGFENKDGKLTISVEDDGAGIDKKAVLKSAKENNLLKKPEEEYTEEEIINLLFVSGISTTEEANDYSGRGVGMDVIRHNVVSLGGSINITSNYGFGTKVVMKFDM
ncbi:MAG: hypothetical protein K1W06_02180 [Lachnospiraceae bacterium]